MSEAKTFSVLLVDDDANMRSMFQLIMKHHRLPLVTVEDAESALDYLTRHTPDVIVMDLMLPGLDGYQALKQLRQKSLAPNSPVIATSAYYTPDTPNSIMAAGFSGFLPKPLTPLTLVHYLQTAAEGHISHSNADAPGLNEQPPSISATW